jgi:hypothetical protein
MPSSADHAYCIWQKTGVGVLQVQKNTISIKIERLLCSVGVYKIAEAIVFSAYNQVSFFFL